MQSKIYKHDRFDLIETIASHMYRSVIALLTPEKRKKNLFMKKGVRAINCCPLFAVMVLFLLSFVLLVYSLLLVISLIFIDIYLLA